MNKLPILSQDIRTVCRNSIGEDASTVPSLQCIALFTQTTLIRIRIWTNVVRM